MSVVKAHRLADGRLYAAAGDVQHCQAVKNWLEAGGDKPTVKDWSGLVIGQDGSVWRYDEMLVPYLVTSVPHAIGSGRDYAMAAMHFGQSATEAVQFAMLYDVYTGGKVTTLKLTV